jgi:hypothetical protein
MAIVDTKIRAVLSATIKTKTTPIQTCRSILFLVVCCFKVFLLCESSLYQIQSGFACLVKVTRFEPGTPLLVTKCPTLAMVILDEPVVLLVRDLKSVNRIAATPDVCRGFLVAVGRTYVA